MQFISINLFHRIVTVVVCLSSHAVRIDSLLLLLFLLLLLLRCCCRLTAWLAECSGLCCVSSLLIPLSLSLVSPDGSAAPNISRDSAQNIDFSPLAIVRTYVL